MSGQFIIALAAVLLVVAPTPATGLVSGAAEQGFADIVSAVSESAMMTNVENLQAFGSREFHLESSKQAAEYIYERLSATGLDVGYQEFMLDGVNVSNVVAIKHGPDAFAGCYLFGAHYDSENKYVDNFSEAETMLAPGADDDASGIAAVLELARLLSDVPLRKTVKFVAFTAEEYGYDDAGGLKGSEFFAASEKEAGVAYEGTAILDMIGYRVESRNQAVLVTNDADDAMAEATAQAVLRYGVDIDLTTKVLSRITYSDHYSFWDAGYPSMLAVEELSDSYLPVNPYYHTSSDVADALSGEQMVAVTQALLGGVLQLTAEDAHDGSTDTIAAAVLGASACAAVAITFVLLRRRRTEIG